MNEIDPELAENPNFETAVFGREVEDFVDNDRIGQYLVKRAREDLEEAQVALLDVDPEDPSEIRRLQNKAAIALSVARWLREAVEQGRAAAEVIQQEHDSGG